MLKSAPVKPHDVERIETRAWSHADRLAGVIPLAALRVHGSEAIAYVVAGRVLTVLKYGRAVAVLSPIVYPEPEGQA